MITQNYMILKLRKKFQESLCVLYMFWKILWFYSFTFHHPLWDFIKAYWNFIKFYILPSWTCVLDCMEDFWKLFSVFYAKTLFKNQVLWTLIQLNLQSRVNTWNKVKKSRKIGQEQDILITTSAQILTAFTKVIFPEGRLSTRLYLYHLIFS